MNKNRLKQFEQEIATLFKAKHIKCPIHLCSGNEAQLIKIFKNIDKNDYIFSTHRNSYHYLLHTGNSEKLKHQFLVKNDSMHTCDPEHHFFTSSIVAGCVSIAAGVALALKIKRSKQRVFCFIGDGAVDEGWFTEAMRYSAGQRLPITYVVEDNNRSVETTKEQRWGNGKKLNVITYQYNCKWPHCGIGEYVNF